MYYLTCFSITLWNANLLLIIILIAYSGVKLSVIVKCQDAKIWVIMITGDNKIMAKAIVSGVKRYFQQKPPVGTLLAERKHKSGKVHVIARGDTLSDIAQRYRVSVADLRRYNSLKSTRIKIGQRIKIPISSWERSWVFIFNVTYSLIKPSSG